MPGGSAPAELPSARPAVPFTYACAVLASFAFNKKRVRYTDGFIDFIDDVLIEAHAAPTTADAVMHCVERAFSGGADDNVGAAITRTNI